MYKEIKKVIVWGDSVARGVIYDDKRARYAIAPENAVKIVSDKLGIEIINRSRMGITSKEGLQLVERDLEKGLVADAVIIEYGGNDCDFNWREISEAPKETHLPKTKAEDFEESIYKIIEKTKKAGIRPVLVSLPPIDADRYLNFISRDGLSKANILKWLGDVNQIYRYHERYSMIITRIARKTGCMLLDLRSAFLDLWSTKDLLCTDGIHPNISGQKFIGEAIISSLM